MLDWRDLKWRCWNLRRVPSILTKFNKQSNIQNAFKFRKWPMSLKQWTLSASSELVHNQSELLYRAGRWRRISNILHMLHNNTQWSQNKMTSFTIFMAFCLLFYTIYNHLICFFQYKGGKKSLCTIIITSNLANIVSFHSQYIFLNCNRKETEHIWDIGKDNDFWNLKTEIWKESAVPIEMCVDAPETGAS